MRAFALLILLTPAVLGAQTVRDSVLSVSVTRSFRITPDRASFFVVVDGTAETSGDALTVGNTKLEAVLRALRGVG